MQLINLATIDFAGGDSPVPPTPPGPTPSVQENDVNLYDYDGTLLHSYSAAEFSQLDNLPDAPVHEGLTAQGWNWSLVVAKEYVSHHGVLDIGMSYTTNDGSTRIYINLPSLRLSPVLGLYLNGSVSVDWGDNSTPDVVTGSSLADLVNTPHDYQTPGEYVITISPSTGAQFEIKGRSDDNSTLIWAASAKQNSMNSAYQNSVRKILIGRGLVGLGDYAFVGCYSLECISIPEGITSIGHYAFKRTTSLMLINVPRGVESLLYYAFAESGIRRAILPNTLQRLENNVFAGCVSLESAIIPDTVTNVSTYAYSGCFNLKRVAVSRGLTVIGDYTFENARVLSTIHIPDNIERIGVRAFGDCTRLGNVVLGSGLKTLDSSSLYTLRVLTVLEIPSGVTTISYLALYGLYSLKSLILHPVVPPAIQANTLTGFPSDAVIYVPAESVDTYKAAANWSGKASQIQAIPNS